MNIKDMSYEALVQLINETVDRRFEELLRAPKDPRSLEEIFDSIDRNRWTPPPGAKSSLELLREDRER